MKKRKTLWLYTHVISTQKQACVNTLELYTTKNVQIKLINKKENKQAKIISFINSIKKTDYKQNALELKIKFMSIVQDIA